MGSIMTALDSTRYFKLANVVTNFSASINGTLRKERVIFLPSGDSPPAAGGGVVAAVPPSGPAGPVGGGAGAAAAGTGTGEETPLLKTKLTPTFAGSRRRLSSLRNVTTSLTTASR